MVRTTLVSILCLLGVAGAAWAHEWSELTLAYETGELEGALSATEAIQASLEAHEAPPLLEDAWAFDWWRWFGLAAQLHEHQGQEALREALASAGFPHASGAAIAAWRDLIEHLVASSDARRAAAEPTPSDDVFETAPTGANPDELVRASYLASLQGTPSGDVPPALLERLDALIDAAKGRQ